MHWTKSIALTAAIAHASPLAQQSAPDNLQVTLERVGNTVVNARITNNGASDLNVLKTGSILDDDDNIEKARVFAGGVYITVLLPSLSELTRSLDDKLVFGGIRLQLDYSALDLDSFQVIPAGTTVEKQVNVALGYDLSNGGDFDIDVAGLLAFSEANSTAITGLASFTSNVVHATVDGKEAGEVHRNHIQNRKRTVVQNDCTGAERTATTNAIANCRSLAINAASVASRGSDFKMREYFKSATATTRRSVSDVFNRIASECGSTTSGVSRQYCTDVYSYCSRGVIAYTAISENLMVNCPYYFTFPASSRTCHAIDQATTTLHEVTHLRPVKGTVDYCYGYDCVQQLSSAQNLNNADTYTLFAQCK